jgi:ribonuclease HI
LVIYTDGSCHPNPGPGGWAAIILDGDRQKVLKGGEAHSTNNRMELTAALKAIQHVPDGRPAVIVTDSQYLKRGVEEWMANWQARGWKRKGGALANIDLWQQLAKALEPKDIRWRWVRGHRGDPLNEQADRHARSVAFSYK